MALDEQAKRKDDLAVIHIIKKEAGLNDVRYREIVKLTTGLSSSARADQQQRTRLIGYLSLINRAGKRREEPPCLGLCMPVTEGEEYINCVHADICKALHAVPQETYETADLPDIPL